MNLGPMPRADLDDIDIVCLRGRVDTVASRLICTTSLAGPSSIPGAGTVNDDTVNDPGGMDDLSIPPGSLIR